MQTSGGLSAGKFDIKMKENKKQIIMILGENDKMWKLKEKIEKTKNWKYVKKNVFDEILNQNQFLRTKFELWEPSGTPKH